VWLPELWGFFSVVHQKIKGESNGRPVIAFGGKADIAQPDPKAAMSF
jgi:hypothetical protein